MTFNLTPSLQSKRRRSTELPERNMRLLAYQQCFNSVGKLAGVGRHDWQSTRGALVELKAPRRTRLLDIRGSATTDTATPAPTGIEWEATGTATPAPSTALY